MPKPRAFTHWTTDTCTAFFMALRFHGTATRAAAEIGRSVASAYKRRERDPDFARRWDEMLAAWTAANVVGEARALTAIDQERAMPNRERFDGFTPLRQRAFLRALTETGDVRAACAKVGLSNEAAYRARSTYPAFAAAWDRALGQSVAVLEQVAYERAVEGVEEQVWHAGKVVGTRRRYSEVLLRSLVVKADPAPKKNQSKKALREAAIAAAKLADGFFLEKPPRSDDEVWESLTRKLDKLALHQRRKGALAAERWLAEGLIP